jgi:hypothetical protein
MAGSIFGFSGGSSVISGGLTYSGTWDASSNSPFLQSGVGTSGEYYIVGVAGNTDLDGITDWNIGDWAIFSNTGVWQKIDNSESNSLLYTVELVSAFTTDFYAPFKLTIDSIAQIVGTATINIDVNGSPYTLGNLVNTGDQITVTSSTTSVVNLNCTKL